MAVAASTMTFDTLLLIKIYFHIFVEIFAKWHRPPMTRQAGNTCTDLKSDLGPDLASLRIGAV